MLTCSSSGYPAPVIIWYICPGVQKTYVLSWISSQLCPLLAPFSESFQWLSWFVAVKVQQSHHLRGSGRWHNLAARWRERYQTPQPASITWWWCHSGMRGQQSCWRVSQCLPASYVTQEHDSDLFSASRISWHEKKYAFCVLQKNVVLRSCQLWLEPWALPPSSSCFYWLSSTSGDRFGTKNMLYNDISYPNKKHKLLCSKMLKKQQNILKYKFHKLCFYIVKCDVEVHQPLWPGKKWF